MDLTDPKLLLSTAGGIGGILLGRRFRNANKAMFAGAGGVLAGNMAGDVVNQFGRKSWLKKFEDARKDRIALDRRRLEDLEKAAPDLKDVDVLVQDAGLDFNNAFYTPVGNMPNPTPFKRVWGKDRNPGDKKKLLEGPGRIYLGRNFQDVATLAHEMGHASDIEPRKKEHVKQMLRRYGYVAGASAGVPLSLLLASMKLRRRGFSPRGTKLVAGAGAATAMTMPLAQNHLDAYTRKKERVASTIALARLQKIYGRDSAEYTQAKKQLRAAYGTYDPFSAKGPFSERVTGIDYR